MCSFYSLLSQKRRNIPPPQSATVKAYENFGNKIPIEKTQPGDIVLFARVQGFPWLPLGASHVGFVSSAPKNGKITIIAGNNGKLGSVEEVTLPLSYFVGARRPKTTTQPQLLSDAAPPLTLAATATTGSDSPTPKKNSNNKSHESQIPASVLDNLTGVAASTPINSPTSPPPSSSSSTTASLTTRNVLQLASALSSFQPDRLSDRSSSLSSPQPSENNSSVFNLASS